MIGYSGKQYGPVQVAIAEKVIEQSSRDPAIWQPSTTNEMMDIIEDIAAGNASYYHSHRPVIAAVHLARYPPPTAPSRQIDLLYQKGTEADEYNPALILYKDIVTPGSQRASMATLLAKQRQGEETARQLRRSRARMVQAQSRPCVSQRDLVNRDMAIAEMAKYRKPPSTISKRRQRRTKRPVRSRRQLF